MSGIARTRDLTRVAAFMLGVLITIMGLFLLVLGAVGPPGSYLQTGVGVLTIGISLAFGPQAIAHLGANAAQRSDTSSAYRLPTATEPKSIAPEILRERQQYAAANPPPAPNPPAFDAVTDVPDMSTVPCGDPLVPTYLLDKNFRILDWNEAFALAFDHSMEGRRGQGAIEWVYLLDNFTDVLNEGRRAFANLDDLPLSHKETLLFTSNRYGKLNAVKRAFQFFDDNSKYAGWVILLDLHFEDAFADKQYRSDLLRALKNTLLWSEYTYSYDQVLTNSLLYQDLISKMLGDGQELDPIPPGVTVLDLGAGTGNFTERLADGTRKVFALENNYAALGMLRVKCKSRLRRDDAEPGVVALKQNINSLFGLGRNYFDYAIANNVFYSLQDPTRCLTEARRVLKPNGELRLSGPAPNFKIDKLFKRLQKDIKDKGLATSLAPHLAVARRVNMELDSDLRRWSERDIPQLLQQAEFREIRGPFSYYDGNGHIYVARK